MDLYGNKKADLGRQFDEMKNSTLTPIEALQAIMARINGDWDHPALRKFGPLHIAYEVDVLEIVRQGLRAPAPTSHQVFDALQVLRLTPHIRQYLWAYDHQALAQADAAVAAEPVTTLTTCEPQLFVSFGYGSKKRWTGDYGPYVWVQLIYDTLYVQILGDTEPQELAVFQDGLWKTDSGELWSDIVIGPAEKIPSTDENWENGRLGCDERFARVASPEEEARVQAALAVSPLRTVAYICTSEAQAKAVVAHVVGQSQWFEFVPLPDGYYEVRVKFDAQWCLPK